ncbi:hypothetical protein KUTeg_018683, partial [Tegillarca granosa]
MNKSSEAQRMNPVDAPPDYPCGDLNFPTPSNIEIPAIITDNDHVWLHLAYPLDYARKIESETRNQADSEVWIRERGTRITASNFGKIMRSKSAISKQFLRSMFQAQSFNSKPTTYGKVNEKTAKQIHMKKTKNHVHDIGLIVNLKIPFLGTTPDGKVCCDGQSGILEIKCPYSIRDSTFQEALADLKNEGRMFLSGFWKIFKPYTSYVISMVQCKYEVNFFMQFTDVQRKLVCLAASVLEYADFGLKVWQAMGLGVHQKKVLKLNKNNELVSISISSTDDTDFFLNAEKRTSTPKNIIKRIPIWQTYPATFLGADLSDIGITISSKITRKTYENKKLAI